MKNIAKALSIFYEEMGTITKDASNPFFHSKYAPLETILPAIKEPLKKAGLVFTQFPSKLTLFVQNTGSDNMGVYQITPALKTIIIHVESGETIESETPLILAKQDPQGVGSAITYMRRYALVSMLGLNCDEDDDGNKASTPKSDFKGTAKAAVISDEDSQLPPREMAERAIKEATTIKGLNEINYKIGTSKVLSAKDKEELSFSINEKLETLDALGN